MQWGTTQVDRGILELQMDGEDMYNQYAGLSRNNMIIERYGSQRIAAASSNTRREEPCASRMISAHGIGFT